jgi:molybdate transport system substrate-binding protein
MTLDNLRDATITRIAIANPRHAPYGMRAEEALRAANLWDTVQPKFVFGESIAQAAQFVQSGNAQLGIIALALALEPQLASQGGYWLIPDNLHQPLTQGFVLTHRAENNPIAQLFSDAIFSVPAQTILQRYGYLLPRVQNH